MGTKQAERVVREAEDVEGEETTKGEMRTPLTPLSNQQARGADEVREVDKGDHSEAQQEELVVPVRQSAAVAYCQNLSWKSHPHP